MPEVKPNPPTLKTNEHLQMAASNISVDNLNSRKNNIAGVFSSLFYIKNGMGHTKMSDHLHSSLLISPHSYLTHLSKITVSHLHLTHDKLPIIIYRRVMFKSIS